MYVKGLVKLTAIVLLFLLSGCASQPALRFVWPSPPERPRMEWIGVYYSEDSLGRKTGGFKALNSFLGAQEEKVLMSPFGVASDRQGRVYVSDMVGRAVHVFDFNTQKRTLLSKTVKFGKPAGITVDSQDRLYVADLGKGFVYVFSPEGKPLFFIGEKELLRPAYVEVDESHDQIYVTDTGDHAVKVFDLQGKFLFDFGERGNQEGQFNSPQGLAISPAGELFVADLLNARIQVFDHKGEFLRMFGVRGDKFFQFENPKDLAFDSTGKLWVLESRRSNLLTMTPEGEGLLVTGEGRATTHPMGFALPKALFIDRDDRIYVADTLNRRFGVWQYLTEAYLAKYPLTDADRDRLLEYMEKVAEGLEDAK